jgi:hypothetical protein
MSKSRTKDRTYLRNREHCLTNSDTCWLCGQWIDPNLKWPDPYSACADHVIPLARGGHLHGELKPAHLRCNNRRKCKMPPVNHARNW